MVNPPIRIVGFDWKRFSYFVTVYACLLITLGVAWHGGVSSTVLFAVAIVITFVAAIVDFASVTLGTW